MVAHFQRWFYIFLGTHSFLIGIFPFFVPVFLWKSGVDMAFISLFIALGATAYIVTLWCWDRLHKRLPFMYLLFSSFALEVLFLLSFFVFSLYGFGMATLMSAAILYGAYNCFFWITQRALFFETISPLNSGKKFGNTQIVTFFLLKIGILVGSFLLETHGFTAVFIASLLISFLGVGLFVMSHQQPVLPKSLTDGKTLGVRDIAQFKDAHGSRWNFLLDGPFLFLESFFWTITLFTLAFESFFHLGMIVIFLAISFSIFFVCIKNIIDTSHPQKVYALGIVAYMASWFLRAFVVHVDSLIVLGIIVLLATWGTSFFRLAYNKRFFDIAHHTSAHQYIFLKSYYSQGAIAVFYAFLACVFFVTSENFLVIQYLYVVAGVSAAGYIYYKK